MDKITVIIVAAGKGLRMGADVPKQFLLVYNKPILIYTIEKIHHLLPEAEIILALNDQYVGYWNKLCLECGFDIKHVVVKGGETRFETVKNCIDKINPNTKTVLVHDGVRPFISKQLIDRLLVASRDNEAVIPVIAVTDSLRLIKEGKVSEIVDRTNYVCVQTPQCFHYSTFYNAYQTPYLEAFTDDASVVEKYGSSITLVDGEKENIKLTTQEDVNFSKFLLKDICSFKK